MVQARQSDLASVTGAVVLVMVMTMMTKLMGEAFLSTRPGDRGRIMGMNKLPDHTWSADAEKLQAIHDKWRELDELQIKLHFDCMKSRRWAALNSLNAIGLELTKPGTLKGYASIGSYIDEKMRTIERAIADLKFDGEIDAHY